MKQITTEEVSILQKNPKNIRNICILAHVDHGKTTLADSLIASNGIISQRLAGKLRYMDNRPDEQKRGITMKSSAISLHFEKAGENYLINLIDSPGHIDFSSEVSTAVRLCDGALVLVDAVEGVCSQTHAVLRQAWLENIQPCLVINKLDRLIRELKLSPLEAYLHIQQILEQVNAITASLFTSSVMERNSDGVDDPEKEEGTEQCNSGDQVYDWNSGLVEADDSNLYFSPDQGNVKFASAVDGWAFGIDEFAKIFAKKLGVKVEVLNKTLWGDFFLNSKTKRIMKGAQSKGKKPLFVQFILDNIWKVYEAVLETRDKDLVEKIVSSLGLKISARDSRFTDPKVYLQTILRQWLPLSDAVLGMVAAKLPSPLGVSEDRIEKLMCGGLRKFESLPLETRELKQAFCACNSTGESPIIAFVSKMVSVPKEALPQNRRRPLTQEELGRRREIARQKHLERSEATGASSECTEPAEKSVQVGKEPDITEDEEVEQETFVAFARIFSGTLRKGQQLYVLGPKYNPARGLALDKETMDINTANFETINREAPDSALEDYEGVDDVRKHMAVCEVGDLFLMMGREFDYIDQVSAGNIVAINGLKGFVLKSATISSSLACPAFTPMPFEARPIVRVALEPEQPSELPSLVKGLKLLNQADPCVRVLVQETGEYVIVTAGEVHLQRCLDDLREKYAGIKIAVSPPITPFRETVVQRPKVDMVNEDVTDADSTQHIQRLPAFMLREIHDWKETISNEFDDETKKINKHSEDRKGKLWKQHAAVDEDVGLIEAKTSSKSMRVAIRAVPLSNEITTLLESNAELMRTITQVSSGVTSKERKDLQSTLAESTRDKIKEFYAKLKSAFEQWAPPQWSNACDAIWSFGPRGMGPNVLLNRIQRYKRTSIWNGLIEEMSNETEEYWENDNSIVSGFQLATLSGPICEEPMMGVCFCVEDWSKLGDFSNESLLPTDNSRTSTEKHSANSKMILKQNEQKVSDAGCVDSDTTQLHETPVFDSGEKDVVQKDNSSTCGRSTDTYGPLSGQLISAVKEGCRRAFMSQPMRLMAAMYSCEIQATAEVLGKMYAVLNKRAGRVLSEDMKEGTDIFNIRSTLPVAESFGFSEEIRKKTSGLASPQLVFSHWEVIDEDPFWIPTTEEEYLLYGEKADSENQAFKYVLSVRKRKGLYVEEKTVEFAEKQRTLKKNK
eukprot:gene9497-10491_t